MTLDDDWLLLRCAVDAAADFPNGVHIHHDNLPVMIECPQSLFRNFICCSVAKLRRNNRAVADVVVNI